MTKEFESNSHKRRIEYVEIGKTYLKLNGFFEKEQDFMIRKALFIKINL